MKTDYDQWINGEMRNPGAFQSTIFNAYAQADGSNRRKLVKAFPEWFDIQHTMPGFSKKTRWWIALIIGSAVIGGWVALIIIIADNSK